MGKKYLVRGKGIYDSDSRAMDGTGLYILDGRVAARGRFEELAAQYMDAEVLDFSQEYLLPGLVNTHVHLEFTPCENTYEAYVNTDAEAHRRQARQAARQLLLSGVTAARDAGSSMELIGWMGAEACKAGMHPGVRPDSDSNPWPVPRLQLAGMPLTVTGGHLGFLGKAADSTEELLAAVQNRKEASCTCIKIIASGGQMTPGSLPEQEAYDKEQIETVVREAHRCGLPTAAHCLTVKSYENAMDGGVDCIEHGACFVRNHRMGLLERRLEPERLERFRGDGRFLMIGFSNNYHKLDRFRDGTSEGNNRVVPEAEAFLLEQEEKECGIFRYLADAGMRPTAGTDAGCGFTYFDETWLELELLVKRCGLTNREAIHAATVAGAQALGWGESLGALKSGYQADFITMAQNPLEDISALRQVSHVFCRGRLVR